MMMTIIEDLADKAYHLTIKDQKIFQNTLKMNENNDWHMLIEHTNKYNNK